MGPRRRPPQPRSPPPRMSTSSGSTAAVGPTGRAILPNAGLPQRVEGQFIYAAGPEYFGRMVGDMLDAGAAIVGGCCGTTPEHIAAMRIAVDRALEAQAGDRAV